jgi:alanine racemase
MAKQSATELLKERISQLEVKQAEEGKALKQELRNTVESLKPVNLLRSSVKEFTTSEELKKTLFETVISLVNDFLAKQLIKPNPSNLVLKLVTTLLQLGVANVLTNNRDSISQFISRWIEKLIPGNEEEQVE